MSFMSAVIDNSPIDQYGAAGNAAQLSNYAQTAFNRSNEMFNPFSLRNRWTIDQTKEDALNLQAQGNIVNRRNAASQGIGNNISNTALQNQNLMNKIQNESSRNFMANLNQQTQLAQGFSGQAGQFTAQGAGIKNSLNQLYRQRAGANQQAKQKSNAMKFDLFKSVAGAAFGPALGAAGGMLGGGLMGMGSGQGFQQGVQQFSSNYLNPGQNNFGNQNTPTLQLPSLNTAMQNYMNNNNNQGGGTPGFGGMTY